MLKYGWKPDLPDHRDFTLNTSWASAFYLPKEIDLRKDCPPIWNQGELGSCTSHAIGALDQFVQKKEGIDDFKPSRLFIYYNERAKEGTADQDEGAQIRTGMKVIGQQGVCHEKLWKYDIEKFAERPPANCYLEGKKHLAIQYFRVDQTLRALKDCLNQGYPFVFGFSVYQSFESNQVASTGIVPMPQPHEKLLGGHAVMAVGYSKDKQSFLIRNSWGTNWGLQGYFWMPQQYLTDSNLSSDFWTLRKTQ